jgi:hypothetical protein
VKQHQQFLLELQEKGFKANAVSIGKDPSKVRAPVGLADGEKKDPKLATATGSAPAKKKTVFGKD